MATALIQGFLPYTLPKNRESHPLESPSVHAGFSVKQNGKKAKKKTSVRTQYLHHILTEVASQVTAVSTLGL